MLQITKEMIRMIFKRVQMVGMIELTKQMMVHVIIQSVTNDISGTHGTNYETNDY